MLSAATIKGLTSMPFDGDGDCTKPRGIYVRESAISVLVDVLSKTAVRIRQAPVAPVA
jgi:hypothetical protein